MREDASFLGKKLYSYGTSKSPVKRAIASGVLSAFEATGSKERTAKKNFAATEKEKEDLRNFLNSKTTQGTLEKLGVNSRAFTVAAFRGYPFNARKYDSFLRAFVVLRDELREYAKQNKKLNPSKYEDIVHRMLTNQASFGKEYEKGQPITTHADYIPLVIEDDSDEYSDSVVSDEGEEDSQIDEQLDMFFRPIDVKGIGEMKDDWEEWKKTLGEIADKETLSSRRNSVLRSIDNELTVQQAGGFCYNETKRLHDIMRQ